jgi:hypothetical protein
VNPAFASPVAQAATRLHMDGQLVPQQQQQQQQQQQLVPMGRQNMGVVAAVNYGGMHRLDGARIDRVPIVQ